MLDISDSAEAKLKEIQDAAIAFTEQLKPNEQVMIIAFDRLIRLITEPSSDRRILLEAVRKTNTGGGTSIYDSVEKVIKRLEKVPGRKAIVIFSDGMDTTSERASFQTSLSLADEFSGLIYSIQYNTYKDIMAAQPDNNLSGNGGSQNLTSRGEPINRAYERGTIYLRTLTGNSGGRFYYADSVNNL